MAAQWNRNSALESVQTRLWRYLSASATTENIHAVTKGLFQLPRGQLRRLTAAHLALRAETASALDAAERVLRELPSSVTRSEVELVGAVRGPVNWTRTQQRQLATGDPTRFVCRPAERRYDTPLARLVHLALRRCSELGAIAELKPSGASGSRIDQTCQRATHLLGHAKLKEVTAVTHLPERTLDSLRRYRHTELLIRFVRAVREAIDLLHPAQLNSVISSQLLAPASDDILFEMLAGFAIVDALGQQGFKLRTELITQGGVAFAQMQGPFDLTLWWQKSVWTVLAKNVGSRYSEALTASAMPSGRLRPDFLLVSRSPRRILMLEVKQTIVEGTKPERRGLRECMAYIHDVGGILGSYPSPHALVIGWNADASPGPAPIVVTSQNQIGDAIALVLHQWGTDRSK